MRVFISWSGEMSKAVAKGLYEWLPDIINAVDPFMSEDIRKGALWRRVLAQELAENNFGIICLTPENLKSTWLHFEAGAIAKATNESLIWTYLFQVQPAQVESPLADFQHTIAEKEDTRKLVHTINEALGDQQRTEGQVNRVFERSWPTLEAKLQAVPPSTTAAPREREPQDMLKEILERVRGLERSASSRASAHLDVITSRPPRVQEAIQQFQRGGSEAVLAVFAQMSPEEREQCDQWFVRRYPLIGQFPTAEHRFRTGVLSEISR
jgi:TIR domain